MMDTAHAHTKCKHHLLESGLWDGWYICPAAISLDVNWRLVFNEAQ